MSDAALVVAVAVPVLLGVVLVGLLARSSGRRGRTVAAARPEEVATWLTARGWRLRDAATARYPAELAAPAAAPGACRFAADGEVAGRPASLQLWDVRYRRRTSPWHYDVHVDVVVTTGSPHLPRAALAHPSETYWALLHLPADLTQTRMRTWSGLAVWGADDRLLTALAPFAGELAAQRAWLVLAPGFVGLAGRGQADAAGLDARLRLAGAVAAALG